MKQLIELMNTKLWGRGASAINPGLVVATVVVFIVLCFASPYFLNAYNLVNVAKALVIVGIAAAGETVVIIAGGFDLSIGSTMAAAGMLAAYLLDIGTGVGPAFLAAIVLGICIGAANGTLIAYFRINPLITTLAMMPSSEGWPLLFRMVAKSSSPTKPG